MSTKREQILVAIATALVGTAGVGTRIYRSRPEALSRAESPAILISPLQSIPDLNVSTYLDHVLTVMITVIARGAIPDQVADATIASIHSKLMADFTLGGVAMDIKPGPTVYQTEEADQAAVLVNCEYNILHRTLLTDLEA